MHPATELAIEKFREVLRVERLLDTKLEEQKELAKRIPPRDMAEYVAITERAREEDAEKRERLNLPAGR